MPSDVPLGVCDTVSIGGLLEVRTNDHGWLGGRCSASRVSVVALGVELAPVLDLGVRINAGDAILEGVRGDPGSDHGGSRRGGGAESGGDARG